MWSRPHAGAPPVGSIEETALPTESTERQNDTVGQETPRSSPGPPPYGLGSVRLVSTRAIAHAEAGPGGSPVVTALPWPSTATHSDPAGQEMAVSELTPSTSVECQLRAPAS